MKNKGEVTLKDIVVTEDPGSVFSDGEFTDCDSDEAEFDGNKAWIDQLKPGEKVTFTFKATVAKDAAKDAKLKNDVYVEAETTDGDTVENSASVNEGSVNVPSGGGGGGGKKPKPEIVAGDVEEILNTEDHFQYVQGYPDGTVGPERNITRAEATVIFFRLLQDHVRAELLTAENEFPDVKLGDWFNLGISTMEYGGFVSGYEDGTFRPNGYITRAELATIISNFDDLEPVEGNKFADVNGHWAEKYINSAAAKGWISGYEDGKFRPNQYITRAETMSMINRVLNRKVDAAGLHADAKQWKDNVEGQWYYYAVLEATNHHDYERADVKEAETWTAINPNKVWEN